MTDSTRRTFLAMAGAGAAVGATAAALPAGAAAPAAEDLRLPSDAEGAMAAYIHDVTKGELTLMIDGREVVVTDKELVARLARAFAAAART